MYTRPPTKLVLLRIIALLLTLLLKVPLVQPPMFACTGFQCDVKLERMKIRKKTKIRIKEFTLTTPN